MFKDVEDVMPHVSDLQQTAQRRPRRRAGFTLVELLVVVSIIALLISILLPSLRGARDQAKLTKCLAHMRGLGQAAMTFSTDHNNLIQLTSTQPGVDDADPSRTKFEYGAGKEILAWPVALAQAAGVKYVNNWDWGIRAVKFADAVANEDKIAQNFELLVCPSDRVRLSSPFYPRSEGTDQGLVGNGNPKDPRPPSNNMAYWGRLSFGINEDVAGYDNLVTDCWHAAPSASGWQACEGGLRFPPTQPCGRSGEGHRLRGNLDKVFDPGSLGLIFETGPESEDDFKNMQSFDEFANLVISKQVDRSSPGGPFLGNFTQQLPSRMPTNRHPKGRVNVLFADTHGASARPISFSKNNSRNKDLPDQFAPRVRVSPYQPHDTN